MRIGSLKKLTLLSAVFLPACGLLSKCTDIEYGPQFRVAQGFEVGDGDVTVHPVGAFSYLKFDGGHDNTFHLGLEVRKPLARSLFDRSDIFVGGAIEFLRYASVYDAGDAWGSQFDGDPTANGARFSLLAGVPVGQAGPFEVNAIGMASYWRYGDFKDDMGMIDTPAGRKHGPCSSASISSSLETGSVVGAAFEVGSVPARLVSRVLAPSPRR